MDLMDNDLEQIAKLLRFYILTMTTKAGSGHLTSSLSAVELAACLFFRHFRFDFNNPSAIGNDRLIFSKGHASPLFFALYGARGLISQADLFKYRTFESNLEGHPTMRFPFTELPTGSLGQGLSVGVGMALALRARISNNPINQLSNKPIIYVLLGDGEMAEGQIWEAIETAPYYKLNNLIAVLDVNRLGQSQQTMLGDSVSEYAGRISAFGWRTYVVNGGHDLELIDKAYSLAIEQSRASDRPAMIIARTIKGKGVSFLEDRNNWHGKTLSKDELKIALKELGKVNKQLIVRSKNLYLSSRVPMQSGRGDLPINMRKIASSSTSFSPRNDNVPNYQLSTINYQLGQSVSTRQAFGQALAKLGENMPYLVVLDADTQNSTYTELFAKKFPERFYQMFLTEQNMLSSALGLAKMGLYPVVSTFAAFLSRAADQLRMGALSGQKMLVNGSHVGVSIGADGPSQMGLNDISMFRSILGTAVLYPSDAVAAQKLLYEAANCPGIVYLRTQRSETEVIYDVKEEFKIGGSKVLNYPINTNKYQLSNYPMKKITVVSCGITVLEALKAQKELAQEKVSVTVIDCYSISPIDKKALVQAAHASRAIVTVEDHYPVGGLGDAVLEALAEIKIPVFKMAVYKTPRSGTPEELLRYEEIDSRAICNKIREII